MKNLKYVFGPIPSRRLGISLGVSPIPKKTCNYSCIYCQLGRTDKLCNCRNEFYNLNDILDEIKIYLKQKIKFDVITLVGEGEPTLYSRLGELICNIKQLTSKPVVVITNSALLYDKEVRSELCNADIVLPSLDAYDEDTFRKINRAYGKIHFEDVYNGLVEFSNEYKGSLWLEIMLINGINDDEDSILKFKSIISNIKYDKLYLNTPVRPPAEKWVKIVNHDTMESAAKILHGISIDSLISGRFFSEIKDDYEAILSIIKRHPMNKSEIKTFLDTRECHDISKIFKKLENNDNIQLINYKGITTYRLK